MRNQLIYILIILSSLIISCDNKQTVEESKKISQNESQELEDLKDSRTTQVDSLSNKVDDLKRQKKSLDVQIAEAEISEIIKNSFFDHVIIGSSNLNNSVKMFAKLGFSIKEGRIHQNGIKNNFVEFNDGSEIEIIEINNPSNNLSSEYSKMINQKKYGLQFALRISEPEKLNSSFTQTNSIFSEYNKNNVYSTISTPSVNQKLPFFFINYKNGNNNTITNHVNKANGISSVWFSTKDIKQTARELVDFGFEAIGNYKIPEMNRKIVQFKNHNFGIILIESDNYGVSGVTIGVEDFKLISDLITTNFDNKSIRQNDNNRNSIFINPTITNSIWIEFFEHKN